MTHRTFTGQKQDGTGLLYMNARFYDPALGVFLSPDTLVPDAGRVVDYNRFAYVRANPLKYSDPSGHCVTNEQEITRDDAYDCTVEEMNALSWETRKWWLGKFATDTGADWFRNILGILDFFASDSDFSAIGGWASYSDAGVLVVLQDGWRRSQRLSPAESSAAAMQASGEWKEFFSLQRRLGDNNPDVHRQWGVAEQAGVNYGTTIAEPLRMGLDTAAEIKVGSFVWYGDLYRGIITGEGNSVWKHVVAPLGRWLASDQLDPRTDVSRSFVNGFSKNVILPTATIVWANYQSAVNGYR